MANFYLSHWNDPQKVFVPEEIQGKLKQYHFSMVRSLYRSIQKKHTGGILSYDDGMNIPLAFQALWHALITAKRIKLPILVIASDNNVVEWHYHLSQIREIIILNSQNYETVVESSDFSIILVPECNLKLLQPFRENEFSFVVIEDFDLIATKVLFKKLSGEFNVALTKRNFMIDRDYKILWHILNWISPGEFGKLNNFADFDRDHLENLRNPYDEIWHSYNYNVGDYNLDDVEGEKKKYQETLKKWAKKNDLPFENSSTKTTRKRKSNFPNGKAVKTKKCSEISKDDMYDAEYHENETQLVQDVMNDKDCGIRDSYETKGIRDVTGLSYSKLIREEVKIVSEKENVEKSPIKCPFLKNKNVNMKRKTFKFLDNENNIPAEKELEHIDGHRIANSRMACGSEGGDSVDRTCTTGNHLTKNVAESVVCVNRKEAESLEKFNINTSMMNRHISFEMENQKTPSSKEDFKHAKGTLTLPSDHNTNKNANVSANIHKQIFPSLEDILTFKKKDIGDILQVRKQAMQIKKSAIRERATKSVGDMKLFSNNSERESIASLEEVFKCKRKLISTPEVIKKLNVESPISANCNNVRMKFTHQDNLKKMKLCQPHRIIYKDIPILNINYKSVELVNKATQTSNELTTTTSYKSSLRHEDTIITPENGISRENFKDTSIAIDELPKTRVSQGNLKEKVCEKPIKDGSDSVSVERNNEIAKRKSTLVSQESFLKDSMNVINEGNVEDEEKELLLSIVEGRFVSQPAIDVDNNNNSKEKSAKTENDNSSKSFKRYNSRTLLGSLFGDDAECLEEKKLNENPACKTKIDGVDRFCAVDDLKTASQTQHLKVRTIDQINGENFGRKSICESLLKFPFGIDGKGDNSSNLAGGKNFGASCYNSQNFSSLFG